MRAHYLKDYRVYLKPDRSKVTDVDLAISELVQERCARHFPDIVLYSEESEKVSIDTSRPHFIIDELDGTSYYIDKLPGFSHQAAFFDGSRGLVIGLVYYPLDDILLYAVRGGGVVLETRGEQHPLTTPPSKSFDQLHLAHPARYRGDRYWNLFDFLGIGHSQVVMTTALRTLEFVRGQLDAAIFIKRHIPEWDWAGEKVIVEELGFNHSYLDGQPIHFGEKPRKDNPGYLICPPEHKEQLIEKAGEYLENRRTEELKK